MRCVDVFNGDADGLCALHQLRLAEPVPAGVVPELVTGLKREIDLLQRVARDTPVGPGTYVTVLDVSLDRNRAALDQLLAAGATVRYFDHHYAGSIPQHARLAATIDTAPDVCTSMLVDRHLGGRYRLWAVAAAFGDNLAAAAGALAQPLSLQAGQLAALRELGEALNYNSYGDSEADVMIHPRDLFGELHRFVDPFVFRTTELVDGLVRQRRADLAAAQALAPEFADGSCVVYRLPPGAWSGRVIGTFANECAVADPRRACAVLKENADGSLAVSVRAPRQAPVGAETLCRRFETGGGRAAAAGIDRLPPECLPDFVRALCAAFAGAGADRPRDAQP
jgi:hypothetical protein